MKRRTLHRHIRCAPPIRTAAAAAHVDELDDQWRIVAMRHRLGDTEAWLWLVDAGAFIRGRDAGIYVSVTGRAPDGAFVTYGKVAG
ncbi:MAG TPA: hypothetical protein VN612_11000 [Acidobacteriaceae bacterium]|nr:hypothetical protein [Acidobacteriaceae bacterium]